MENAELKCWKCGAGPIVEFECEACGADNPLEGYSHAVAMDGEERLADAVLGMPERRREESVSHRGGDSYTGEWYPKDAVTRARVRALSRAVLFLAGVVLGLFWISVAAGWLPHGGAK